MAEGQYSVAGGPERSGPTPDRGGPSELSIPHHHSGSALVERVRRQAEFGDRKETSYAFQVRLASTILALGGLMSFGAIAQADPVAQAMLVLPCDRPVAPAANAPIELRCRVAPNQVLRIML